jgi:hypothetical protein
MRCLEKRYVTNIEHNMDGDGRVHDTVGDGR